MYRAYALSSRNITKNNLLYIGAWRIGLEGDQHWTSGISVVLAKFTSGNHHLSSSTRCGSNWFANSKASSRFLRLAFGVVVTKNDLFCHFPTLV